MRWYRIEFFKTHVSSCKEFRAHAIANRIAIVERQYSTQGRAQAAADKMAMNLRRQGYNVMQYDVTPL